MLCAKTYICHCCCVFRNDIHYDIQMFDHLNPEYDFCDIFLFSVSFLFTKMIISMTAIEKSQSILKVIKRGNFGNIA